MQCEAKWLKSCLFTSAATLWWSSIGPLPSLRLKSSSCVKSLWYARRAVAERVTSATGKKYVHLSTWMTKAVGLWVVLKCCLARLVWTFTPKLSTLLLKRVIQWCCWVFAQLAVIHSLSIHLFTVTSVLLFWWGGSALGGVVFVLFLTRSYRLSQKIFKYIFLEFVNSWAKWAVNAWVCCIGPSVWVLLLTFQKQHGALDMQSKWVLSHWQKTQQTSKSA